MQEERERDGISSREEQRFPLRNELVFNRLRNVTTGVLHADNIVSPFHALQQRRWQNVRTGARMVIAKHHWRLGRSCNCNALTTAGVRISMNGLTRFILARLRGPERDDWFRRWSNRCRLRMLERECNL
jgi:uncharacterized protein YigA (DUF484 family)